MEMKSSCLQVKHLQQDVSVQKLVFVCCMCTFLHVVFGVEGGRAVNGLATGGEG